ncbi:MAG: mechanosensitive ion channel family protein [Acidobacteria bacterium]|nr:mechanosensitive ion channel family protein [Acidobacteriota bacterium]
MSKQRVVLPFYLTLLLLAGFVCAAHAQQTPPAKSNTAQSSPKQTMDENTALPEKAPVHAAPVVPFHQPIFSVYAKLGSFTPAERAEKLEQRIRQLAEDRNFSPEQLEIVPDGATMDIVYGDFVIMAVADGDAEYFQKSKIEVAEYYKENIARAIEQYRQDTELVSILTKTGLVALILALFFFIIRYVNGFHRVARRKIVSLRGTFIKGVKIKSYSLFDEDKCIIAALFFVKIIKYVVILTILYFSLPLLFSVFPETRGLANKLLDYVLTPFSDIVLNVIGYLPNAITIVVIVTIFLYLTKGIKYFAGEIEKEKLVIKGFYPDWAIPTYNIIRTLLFAFMFIVIFPHLPNSESKIFQGVSVFIGVLISLGSTALIGNLISGMVLTYMRPFRTGDFIKIGDVLGTVKEKTPLAIRIMTTKNEEITLPNSTIMSAHTTNYSHSARENNLVLYATVTFGYDTPWRQVHELLLSAAARTKHVLADPAPYVLQRALDNFFAEYQINVYTTEEKLMPRIYSELYGNIQDVFNEAGLDMTSPSYQNFRGENQIQVTQKNFSE